MFVFLGFELQNRRQMLLSQVGFRSPLIPPLLLLLLPPWFLQRQPQNLGQEINQSSRFSTTLPCHQVGVARWKLPTSSSFATYTNWLNQVVMRTRGESAGKYDVYVYSPGGMKFRWFTFYVWIRIWLKTMFHRSNNEVQCYLTRRGITDIDPESISFKVEGPAISRLSSLQ